MKKAFRKSVFILSCSHVVQEAEPVAPVEEVKPADVNPADSNSTNSNPANPDSSDVNPPHVHSVGQKHEAVPGTCVTKGTLEYYDCTDCDAKLDALGNELESIEGELNPSNHEHLEGKKCTSCEHEYPLKYASMVGFAEDDAGVTTAYLKVYSVSGIPESVCCYVILQDADYGEEPLIFEGEYYEDYSFDNINYQYKVKILGLPSGYYYVAGIVKWSDVDLPYQLDTVSDNWDLDLVNPYNGDIRNGAYLDFCK